jgi:hypothetical protein
VEPWLVSATILALSFFAPACAHSQRPVLCPNDHLQQVGNKQAQADIDACMRLATEYGGDSESGSMARGGPSSDKQDPVFRHFVDR